MEKEKEEKIMNRKLLVAGERTFYVNSLINGVFRINNVILYTSFVFYGSLSTSTERYFPLFKVGRWISSFDIGQSILFIELSMESKGYILLMDTTRSPRLSTHENLFRHERSHHLMSPFKEETQRYSYSSK
uniref:Uncharacterized protein n=1 Tax=Salix viminalis TaxID=40686 RepID=A0A6N2LEE1_SALVM